MLSTKKIMLYGGYKHHLRLEWSPSEILSRLRSVMLIFYFVDYSALLFVIEYVNIGCVACSKISVRVFAQTVSRRVSVEVQFKYKAYAFRICGGQYSITTGFLHRVVRSLPISMISLCSILIHSFTTVAV